MHPAPSVIIFTTLSGLGFGLFFWLGLGVPDVSGGTAFAFFTIAYALSCAGLLASTFHLGNKKNAIYALSQWRTSWLSREGIAAIVTLILFALVAVLRIFLGADMAISGSIGSILALVTVFTTSMIYTQLKTIPRWNQPLTPVIFLLHALGGGALLAGEVKIAGWLLLALTLVLFTAWQIGDKRANARGTTSDATGLAHLGEVRLLESGHTARNYVVDEMVYRVGRKHAEKLRWITLALAGVLPFVILLLTPPGHMTAFLALALHLVGATVGRWLFFAEAEHVVGLYHGK
ncbi:DmsC/YnfH family molybdoenzyme membrane anchor subunit [Aliiroseovarius sp. F47248L]|uniref:dimethyl sulfoxide reductase anchor subunit family protein n=1 Tax=Aliiroseovarius sp. F47248L TaxID=2926420 RepID=UPI001FF38BB5|nr:DmsC/YnfH family molybdoenzyme membrane anchor subunit [Aliiroseovarius sp. F47248L]MCK0140222.1 dimethyl sulfoxide reductase anchor subunit [Aliiroseovarius sp. F47248L]